MPNNPDFDTAALSLPAEMTAQSPLDIDMLSMEWENIGEESFINICEVQLKFNGMQLSKSMEITCSSIFNIVGSIIFLPAS
jgi:hypothetical protein